MIGSLRLLVRDAGLTNREFAAALKRSYSSMVRQVMESDLAQLSDLELAEVERALCAKPGTFVALVKACQEALRVYYAANPPRPYRGDAS